MSFIIFQTVFVVLQISVFYLCIVQAPESRDLRANSDQLRENKDTLQPAARAGEQLEAQELQKQNSVQKFQQNAAKVKEQDTKLKYQPNWESLDSRPLPEWYDDAKLGIFIHWGVFAVPSFVGVGTKGLSEWFWWYWKEENYINPVSEEGAEKMKTFRQKKTKAIESVKEYMKQNYPPNWHYTDFAPQFTAEFFDPTHWADIFKKSGAKYVILTSKHHDGFTLWPSKRSWNWNAVDNGPHRDLVGDLGDAVKKAGLHYGLYHSLYEWFNPLYEEDKKNNFQTQSFIKDKMMPELKELVTTYKPDIVWSDGQFEAPCSYWNCTDFLAWLYNESPVKDQVVTNDRWGTDVLCKHGGYLTCHDRYNPAEHGEKQGRKWENCMTIDQESWGYRRNAKLPDYFDMDGLTKLLAQTVSHGGNLLMNIGPTADGRIPPIFEERLRQMGTWLTVNGDAIYGTRMWHTSKEKDQDIFYTKKTNADGTFVYAIVMDWPKNDKLDLRAAQPTDGTKVSWLGYQGNIEWQRGADGGMSLTLPKMSMGQIPCQWAWTFKITNLHNLQN